jgi:hypothetical protein
VVWGAWVYQTQVADLKAARLPENKHIHTLLLDPAVHREFLRLQVNYPSHNPSSARRRYSCCAQAAPSMSLASNTTRTLPTRIVVLHEMDAAGSTQGVPPPGLSFSGWGWTDGWVGMTLCRQHEAEEAKKQAKTLQGQLEAVTYTPESANGRRLRAQLITWQKENDELAAQVSEGTVHKLECEVALLKDYLTAVKRADHQLVCVHEHCFAPPSPTSPAGPVAASRLAVALSSHTVYAKGVGRRGGLGCVRM